ncbi:MAG: 50S ribosomal protein L29 [Candidatus Portiera sp.]|nr:50S ribosomal protein L29 [Portiera sp.]
MAKEKQNLRALSDAERQHMLMEKTEDMFRYRLQFATGQLGQNHLLRETRREIARLKTLIRESQLKKDGQQTESK